MERTEINNLITLAGEGDDSSMTLLYEGIGRLVYAFILSYISDKEDAEDIMQDTFMKLFISPKKMTDKDNGLAYILTIARNLSLNHIKKQRRITVTEDDSSVFFKTTAVDVGLSTEIKELLNGLSEEERRVFILKEVYGFTFDEIRKIMKLSIATVKRRMENARKILKDSAEL